MTTIAQLTKERLQIREQNPTRSKALTLLIDLSQKLAKESSIPVNSDIIGQAAKKLFKETEKDIAEFEKLGQDLGTLKGEQETYKEFLPFTLTEEQIRELVMFIPEHVRVKPQKKFIMAELRSTYGIDMGILAKILDEVLV